MNEWTIILLPALPSVVVGVAAIVGFTLYVREKRTGRSRALLEVEKEYQELQQAYGRLQFQIEEYKLQVKKLFLKFEQLKEDYGQLQVDHGVDLSRADVLEQEVERLKDQTWQAKELCQQLQEVYDVAVTALATSEDELESMTKENVKLHTREKLLIDTLNKQYGAVSDGVADDTAAIQANINRERGHVDEAPQVTVETNTVQDSPKPVRAKRRNTPSSN